MLKVDGVGFLILLYSINQFLSLTIILVCIYCFNEFDSQLILDFINWIKFIILNKCKL